MELLESLIGGGVSLSPFILAIFLDYHKKENYKKGFYFILFIAGGLVVCKILVHILGIMAAISVPFLLAGFIWLGHVRNKATRSKHKQLK